METTIVAIFRPNTINLINATHQQFEFGIAVLLLSPVVWSIMAFLRSLQSEELSMTSKPRKYGFVAWLVSTSVGLLLSFLSKSSVLLGLSITVPLMVACLSVGIPTWIRNGYKFGFRWWKCNTCWKSCYYEEEGALFAGSLLALGGIISAKPLDDLSYKGWTDDQKGVSSLMHHLCILPSSCLLGASYMKVVNSRSDQIPTKTDFLAALLPLICMPAILSLCSGLLKWKDDNWKISRGAYIFIIIGLVLLLGAISAITLIIEPWTVLLSPPIVVYSPRVLPVYVYDAHADCGKNVSLKIYPPFAGAAVSAITLVVAFGFAVSRSCLTLEMVEDAVHFLSKETVIQAIARSATKVVSEWMRPIEIVKEKHLDSSPCLFSGTANPSDFVSSMVPHQHIVAWDHPPFMGEWVPVVVDDWIPCESHGKPAFATSRKGNELWVSILEKAYAKLHGSYEALEGGLVQDALVDLTGGAGEEIDMRSAQSQIDLASGRLWSQLLRFKQEGFLLGAGSPSGSDVHVSSCGIVQGHAYSILQVRDVDGHKLVQIRNPWANEVEWNGPWSDSSPEWTDRMKHKLKHVPQGVSFSRTTAGFRNYQSSHDSMMFYIGMRILKTRGRRAAYNIYLHESVGGTDYVNSREISCEMVLDPDPKGYTIVPTTIHPGEEAPFVLSVFTKSSITLEAL
ncbi:UNVERIFIED_CONTAM: Calpain-type cysteine protease DEK1 [Sesamum radiatum]|uniref:Calpain-type cysteine protease DEK1 n=1 Tax=Sesamum radiatum TaxID=300843 RepID=A0AAW2W3X6_SESRA